MPPRVLISPPRPGSPGAAPATVRNGIAVSGRDWAWLALAVNFCRGRGCVLVPAHDPLLTVAASTSVTLRFQTYRRYPSFQNLWLVRMHRPAGGVDDDASVGVKVPSGGTTQTQYVSSPYAQESLFAIVETGVTQVEGEAALSIDIANNSPTIALVVDQVECVEMPRVLLGGGSDSGEHGADQDTCRGGDPMFMNTAGRSLGGVIEGYFFGLDAQTTRGALFSWAVPDGSALSTASTTDVDVLQPTGSATGNPKVPVLASRGPFGVATRTVQIRARLKVSGAGVGGRVRFTDVNGNFGDCTCTAGTTSFAWYSGTLVIDAEDLSTSDGRVGGVNEELSIVFKNTGTAGTVYCSGLAVLKG